MNPTIGTILLDLDDTLLYTQKFKQVLIKSEQKAAIPDDISKKANEEFRRQNHGHMDFKGYAEFLKKHYQIEIPKEIIKEVYNLPLQNYLKGEVISTVNKLKEKGYEVRLLSKGSPDFQMYKIRNAGLYDHFHPFIHICTDKKTCIQELNLSGQVIIVNDRLKETKAIRDMFPNFRYIHVKRDDDHGLYEQSEVDMEEIGTIEDLLNKL